MKQLANLSLALLIVLAATVNLSAQTETFRYAFFTDIHIGTPTATKDLTDAINDVNTRTDIDFVWVNGDLTELGTNAQLDEVKSMLDQLNVPYYAIAGNHETKWSESGNTYFSAIFGDNKHAFQHKGVQLIGVSSGPLLRMGDGHISNYDLSWMRQQLKNVSSATPVIFATHYQLMGDMDNVDEVLETLYDYNTVVALCGHGHRNNLLKNNDITNVMCRAVVSSGHPEGGYTIIEVAKDSLRFFEKNYNTTGLKHWLSIPNERGINEFYEPPLFKVSHSKVLDWQFQADGTVVTSAAAGEGKAVVGDETGNIYCLDLATGRHVWTFEARNAVYSIPPIKDGRVVFGSCDSSVYCLNLTNGQKLWEYKTNHAVMGTPLIDGKTVYVGGSDGCYRALNVRNGKLKWQFCELEGYIESKPILYDGKLIFGAWDTYLYALNPKNGELIWKWTNEKSMHMSPAACIPVAAHGKVFVVAPDRFMTALDARTGAVVWRDNRHKVRESIGVSEDGEGIYARCFDDTVFRVKSAPDTFQEEWFVNAGYGYDINPSMIQEADGRVYFTTKNGLFLALDPNNSGRVVWKYKFENTIINTPTIVKDEKTGKVKLLFTTHDGIVGVINPQEW